MSNGMSGWVAVSPEVARTHPLYGIGGWLILVIIGMVLTPIRSAVVLYPIYSEVDFASLPTDFQTLLYVEIGFNLLLIVWTIVNLVLLLMRHPAFPTSYVTLLAFALAFVVVDAIAVKLMMDHLGQAMTWAETFDPETLREIGRTAIAAAIWIPYTIVSRRVNVTYRHRVRANDAILSPKPAPA